MEWKYIFIIVLVALNFTQPLGETTVKSVAEESRYQQETNIETTESNTVLIEQVQESEITYSNDLERALEINEKLFDLYGVWTAVIGIVLILVSIVGIAVPFYMNSRTNKKIRKGLEKLKKQMEEYKKENIKVSNALMLSASRSYEESNEILNEMLKVEPHSVYLHLLIGRNIFLNYENKQQESEYSTEELKEIQEAIEHYIFVAEHSTQDDPYYNLGAIYSNSIVLELCTLTEELLRYSIGDKGRENYHKLIVKVLRTVEKVLHYDTFDDIANEEPTNVFLMSYKMLNFNLAKSYCYFGNIKKAKEQLEYSMKLFTITNDDLFKEEINQCHEMLTTMATGFLN